MFSLSTETMFYCVLVYHSALWVVGTQIFVECVNKLMHIHKGVCVIVESKPCDCFLNNSGHLKNKYSLR